MSGFTRSSRCRHTTMQCAGRALNDLRWDAQSAVQQPRGRRNQKPSRAARGRGVEWCWRPADHAQHVKKRAWTSEQQLVETAQGEHIRSGHTTTKAKSSHVSRDGQAPREAAVKRGQSVHSRHRRDGWLTSDEIKRPQMRKERTYSWVTRAKETKEHTRQQKSARGEERQEHSQPQASVEDIENLHTQHKAIEEVVKYSSACREKARERDQHNL